jgi:hypothetical protein
VSSLREEKLHRIFYDFLYKGVGGSHTTDFRQVYLPQLSDAEQEKISRIYTSYLYRSRRLPRTFMNLIRQDLNWIGTDAYLEIPDNFSPFEKPLMDILKELFEKINLSGDIPETIKDHFVMQLFLVSKNVDGSPKSVTLEEFNSSYVKQKNGKKNVKYMYEHLLPTLLEYIRELYNECEKQGLINAARDTTKAQSSSNQNVNDELERFKNDFLNFFAILQKNFPSVTLKDLESGENITLDKLIKTCADANIIEWKNADFSLLKENLNFYESRKSDDALFKELREWTLKNNISFNYLYQQLFKWLARHVIQDVFHLGYAFTDYDSLTVYEKDNADFKITRENVSILFDYKFIDGTVHVPSDEVRAAIRILDDYNLQTGQVNYYIQIIFYKSDTPTDSEKIRLLTRHIIESERKDFVDKIDYIIVAADPKMDEFEFRIKELQRNIPAYDYSPNLKSTSRGKNKRSKSQGIDPVTLSKKIIIDKDDAQRGRWGGKNEVNGRKLWASVQTRDDKEELFSVDLWVETVDNALPLTGKVTFHLHDSFSPDQITVIAENNRAEINNLECHEAFTVGATCDQNTTKLELDLNVLPDAPIKFKY